MKKTIVLFLCMVTLSAYSQYYPAKSLEDFHFKLLTEKEGNSNRLDYSAVQGSPFLNKDFQQGEVSTTSNTAFNNVLLRYNIYEDEMEFEAEDKKTFYLEKSTIKNVKIGDSEFIYKAYASNNKLGRSYFEVLLRGKATLLKQYRVVFEAAKLPKAYEDATPAQFKTSKSEFYIAFGDEEANRISGFKELLDLLPDKKMEVAEFLKKNKLTLGKQEDIIQVIQFYNEGQ